VKVTVRCFASLKEVVGGDVRILDLEEGSTVETVLDRFTRESPAFGAYRGRLMTAINREYAEAAAPLRDGDELALFPPVSGG
jgi:molybdopterin converting factor subunit 1